MKIAGSDNIESKSFFKWFFVRSRKAQLCQRRQVSPASPAPYAVERGRGCQVSCKSAPSPPHRGGGERLNFSVRTTY